LQNLPPFNPLCRTQYTYSQEFKAFVPVVLGLPRDVSELLQSVNGLSSVQAKLTLSLVGENLIKVFSTSRRSNLRGMTGVACRSRSLQSWAS
jgi:hypothetical protein